MKSEGKKLFNFMMMAALTGVVGATAAGELLGQLGGALKREMGGGGPEAAISVCREFAPQ